MGNNKRSTFKTAHTGKNEKRPLKSISNYLIKKLCHRLGALIQQLTRDTLVSYLHYKEASTGFAPGGHLILP